MAVFIHPSAIVSPEARIGANSYIGPFCSIGPQVERDFVTINGGTRGVTTVGSKCVFLRGSHVGHDAVIRVGVNLSCNELAGGHSIVDQEKSSVTTLAHSFQSLLDFYFSDCQVFRKNPPRAA